MTSIPQWTRFEAEFPTAATYENPAMDVSLTVEFGHEDVVRHKLVQRIVEAYKRHAEETGTARKK